MYAPQVDTLKAELDSATRHNRALMKRLEEEHSRHSTEKISLLEERRTWEQRCRDAEVRRSEVLKHSRAKEQEMEVGQGAAGLGLLEVAEVQCLCVNCAMTNEEEQ